MKKKLISTIVIGLVIVFGAYAQECNATLFLQKGNILEYTSYNKKGKAENKGTHETLSVKNEGDKLIADIESTSSAINGSDSFTSQYQVACEDGLFSIDMVRFFDMSTLQDYDEDDFNIEIDGTVLEFPKGAVAGDILNDGSITVRVAKDDFTIVTMIMDVKNRKVHNKESITTPAGTFTCQKVTFDFYTKIGFIKVQGSGVEWYQDDRVLVRSESYNKKGKLIGYTELTEIKE